MILPYLNVHTMFIKISIGYIIPLLRFYHILMLTPIPHQDLISNNYVLVSQITHHQDLTEIDHVLVSPH